MTILAIVVFGLAADPSIASELVDADKVREGYGIVYVWRTTTLPSCRCRQLLPQYEIHDEDLGRHSIRSADFGLARRTILILDLTNFR